MPRKKPELLKVREFKTDRAVKIPWEQVDRWFIAATEVNEAAARLGISIACLRDHCVAEKGMTTDDYRRERMAQGFSMLREVQFNQAMKGNVPMLIHLGKNLLGQTDRIDHTVDMFSKMVNKEGRNVSMQSLDDWENKELEND